MQSSNAARAAQTVTRVPGSGSEEMERVAEQTLTRCTFDGVPQRKGKGVAIVWFRNDLRILDNEVLFKAWASSEAVLPVYCVDPRLFGTTHYFGFPKTGALRAQFLIECLIDLKKSLMKRGLNLLIQHGKPERILPSLAKAYGVHTVYAQKETCSEELNVERLVSKNLQKVILSSAEGVSTKSNPTNGTKLELIWGCSMYHIDDLPFSCMSLPDVYTQFRKVSKGMAFVGGESAALSRDLLRTYKVTRNGMLGPDYSTKFSPWLASGSLSPRFIYQEVKRYEKQREANDSTYWVLFELIWRDYFKFLSIKQGNSLFHAGGPRKVKTNWSQDQALFDAWRDGRTGYPLIDANMKELLTTGFISNRGRQIVCSFLVRDMGIDWRMGAEWFETCLLDYDPCSNYGNWTYGAGVGNDPREDRYFSIPKQAQNYDSDGEFVAYWLPQLRALPKEKRHFPGMSYIKPIVALKFGNTKAMSNRTTAPGNRRNATEEKWMSRKGNRVFLNFPLVFATVSVRRQLERVQFSLCSIAASPESVIPIHEQRRKMKMTWMQSERI
ncbi:UNVERIFIED_CONTAM: Cryptochrome DASH, chloroplastic/mitochondrial [Sesamum radiatum]|uniref:Cryptochrome DASH n=1 Tax=Sesamum radiatum TaxID=300843 RepID=A0AAW2L2R8_SESRA